MAKPNDRPSKSSSVKAGTHLTPNSSPAAMSARDRVLLIGIGLLVVMVTAYLALRDGDSAGGTAGGDTAMEHVHGLGVDPETGTLYAGTHYGLFRLPENGKGRRVADRVQDFMGFTVAGPGHFLASGHPGEGQDGPSSLGLIESTDNGRTWHTLSLAGEADFHALEYRHGRVYGVNSMTGQFMVSDDKTTWDGRTNLPIADFAVSPDGPDVIVATTEQGLARSEDGGRNFALVQDAPLLLLVGWAEDGTLVGIGPEGTVYASPGEAGAWEQRGALESSPEALAAVSQDEIYAAAHGTVLLSTDGGRSFTLRYPE